MMQSFLINMIIAIIIYSVPTSVLAVPDFCIVCIHANSTQLYTPKNTFCASYEQGNVNLFACLVEQIHFYIS